MQEIENTEFTKWRSSAVPFSNKSAGSTVFEEDLLCNSAKDMFVLILESEQRSPLSGENSLFSCTASSMKINIVPASATRSRKPGVNVKLENYTVRMEVGNVLEVKDGISGKYILNNAASLTCEFLTHNVRTCQLRSLSLLKGHSPLFVHLRRTGAALLEASSGLRRGSTWLSTRCCVARRMARD